MMGRRPYTAKQREAAFWARTMPEPMSGCLLWLGHMGKPSGRNPGGYGRVDGRLAHRVAWEHTHGPIHEGVGLDHRCRNPTCVNVEHLRLSTDSQNQANRRSSPGSASRFKGVYRAGRRWKAQVTVQGRHMALGRYGTEEEAAQAYDRGARKHFGAFALTNEGMGLI